MNEREQMLALLGISPDLAPATPGPGAPASVPASSAPLSDTVLNLDDWTRRRGGQADGGALAPLDEAARADLFGACFLGRPELAENPTDSKRSAFVRELLESDDFQGVRAGTVSDVFASEAAAARLADSLGSLDSESSGEAASDDASACSLMAAAAQATADAAEECDQIADVRGLLAAQGCTAGEVGKLDYESLQRYMDRIKRSRVLSCIVEDAGRMRQVARSCQKRKFVHGSDDIHGVELGDDLARLLPTELSNLADEDFEWLALKRLQDRQLFQWDFREPEYEAKGPIVVLCDESGSMSIDMEHYEKKGEVRNAPIDKQNRVKAKALCATLGWVAKFQRRWICFVSFGERSDPVNVLAMPPGGWDDLKFLDWLEHFYDRGTDASMLCDKLPRRWDDLGTPKGKTDIIVITDGEIDAGKRQLKQFEEWKAAERAKVYALFLGRDSDYDGGAIGPACDHLYGIPNLENVQGEAIRKVLSV